MESYISGIEQELSLYEPADLERVSTIFWGGGTPGLLAPGDLEKLGQVLLEKIGNRWTEWTVEIAPITAHPDRFKALHALGVTRISMGVQSFNDRILDALGRTHPRKQIFRAWDLLEASDFQSLNLDLIFAVPGQTDAELEDDLKQACALGPQHLSTYCLTFEEDTKLWLKLSKGEIKRDPEAEERHYRLAWQTLEAAGYPQYEVSNFSKPGHTCIHNINTWNMQEWIGVGPSASSQFKGRRYTNSHSLVEWRSSIEANNIEASRMDIVKLDTSILLADRIGFGLRMNAGIPIREALLPGHADPLNALSIWPWMESLKDAGLAEISADRFSLTLDGRLVADAIAAEVMERLDGE